MATAAYTLLSSENFYHLNICDTDFEDAKVCVSSHWLKKFCLAYIVLFGSSRSFY